MQVTARFIVKRTDLFPMAISCSFLPSFSTSSSPFQQVTSRRPGKPPRVLAAMSSQLVRKALVSVSEAASTVSDLSTGISEGLMKKMVADALVWSSLHGLVVGDPNMPRSGVVPGTGLVHAPFALLPFPFPQIHWETACELAPVFNELVDRVSLDGEFLQHSLSKTRKVDPFTSRLLDIHSTMLRIGKKEEIRLGLHRSDYMLDSATNSLYQIEMNTIASGTLGLGSLVPELHRTLLDSYQALLGLDSSRIAANDAVSGYAEALARAWHEYNDPKAVVMMVVCSEERNMYDQHWLSTTLLQKHGAIITIRKTLDEINCEGELRHDGTLCVDGHIVGVVYFRAGYSPSHYPSENEWRARLLIERSSAIKCPTIGYHLAGTKKIQRELAKPNILERFLDDKDDIEKVRKCFAGLWGPDDPEIIEKVKKSPENFVLKPQREGGGNNIYGDAVGDTIAKLQGREELAAYILMQRIFPKPMVSYLVRNGSCNQENAIAEHGIYASYLRNGDKLIINDPCGYLVRTKASTANEGGVCAGFSVLDSVYLI